MTDLGDGSYLPLGVRKQLVEYVPLADISGWSLIQWWPGDNVATKQQLRGVRFDGKRVIAVDASRRREAVASESKRVSRAALEGLPWQVSVFRAEIYRGTGSLAAQTERPSLSPSG